MNMQNQEFDAASTTAPSGNGPLASADSGVEKIRDLLFGSQLQDYDRRFANLEDRFQKRQKELEAETARSLGAFEANAKKQVESVANQLREEKDGRAEAEKELERSIRDQTQVLEKRLRQLSDQLAQLERDVTDRFSQASQSLHEEIKRKNDDTRQAIERMFAELSGVKTDRNLLAGLFVEVAKALNQDAGGKPGATEPGRGWQS